MRTYTAVFAVSSDASARRFMELTIHAKDHNDMIAQVRGLACPEGYHYVGTRTTNNWEHLPRVTDERASLPHGD